jgi:parallel beta-helix repeat protein
MIKPVIGKRNVYKYSTVFLMCLLATSIFVTAQSTPSITLSNAGVSTTGKVVGDTVETSGGPNAPYSYMIYVVNATHYAAKASNGTICWTSTNAHTVIDNALYSQTGVDVVLNGAITLTNSIYLPNSTFSLSSTKGSVINYDGSFSAITANGRIVNSTIKDLKIVNTLPSTNVVRAIAIGNDAYRPYNLMIDNVEVQGSGICITSANYSTIQNSYVHDILLGPSGSIDAGIVFHADTALIDGYNKILGNTVYNVRPAGIMSMNNYAIIQNNHVTKSGQSGNGFAIDIAQSSGNIVSGNIIDQDGNGGITSEGALGHNSITNNKISNGVYRAIDVFGTGGVYPSDVVISGNTIYNGVLGIFLSDVHSATIDKNIISVLTGQAILTSFSSLTTMDYEIISGNVVTSVNSASAYQVAINIVDYAQVYQNLINQTGIANARGFGFTNWQINNTQIYDNTVVACSNWNYFDGYSNAPAPAINLRFTNNIGMDGYTQPVGFVTVYGGLAPFTPTVPSTGVYALNYWGMPIKIYILSIGITTACTIKDLHGVTQAITTTLTAGQEITLDHGSSIAFTYSSAPTWAWCGT